MVYNNSRYKLPADKIINEDWLNVSYLNAKTEIDWLISKGLTYKQALKKHLDNSCIGVGVVNMLNETFLNGKDYKIDENKYLKGLKTWNVKTTT